MPEIIRRRDALALALSRYFTGKPCKHGHVSERRTDTGNCVECTTAAHQKSQYKERMRLYMRTLRIKQSADRLSELVSTSHKHGT
jgi:hypothetical protein